jgi:hypothetical protein
MLLLMVLVHGTVVVMSVMVAEVALVVMVNSLRTRSVPVGSRCDHRRRTGRGSHGLRPHDDVVDQVGPFELLLVHVPRWL